ncbi:Pr6Pr family membrane protein [Congzhengia sp.]|uniref:Pr6Pr family membrane protein n=1 Tax=Congzhengia sp. TaxID=2944168 RepID=UPI003077AA62
MKQTISMIYRLGFILFFIWASFENAALSLQGFFGSLKDLAVLTDTICFICIAVVFVLSISGRFPEFLLKTKAVCTAMAVLVLMMNFTIWFVPAAPGWILKVLLPALMFFDWLLFDKKGIFKPYDPLLWLLGIVLLYGIWSLLSRQFFNLDFLLKLFGGKEALIKTLLFTLAAGALMYLTDRLFSGKGAKLWDVFSYLYRILFLCLEGWALSNACGHSLLNLFFSLKNFGWLFNFLSFLCIAVVVITCLVRSRGLHASTPFPRVKGAFTASALIVLFGYHFVLKGGFHPNDPVSVILHYVGPLMMIFDWILFDSKGKFKLPDPLWWSAAPFAYGVILLVSGVLFQFYPALLPFRLETVITFGILGVLACGYAVYLLDLCFKRK